MKEDELRVTCSTHVLR